MSVIIKEMAQSHRQIQLCIYLQLEMQMGKVKTAEDLQFIMIGT